MAGFCDDCETYADEVIGCLCTLFELEEREYDNYCPDCGGPCELPDVIEELADEVERLGDKCNG